MRRIRLYWCSNDAHDGGPDLEYVQPVGRRDGHYHVAELAEALRWYGYDARSERIEVVRFTVDA